VPRVVSAASVFLLVVGAGWRALLRSCPEAAMVPAEGGCGVASGEGSAVWWAIPGAGVPIPGAGTRVPGAEGRVPEADAETVHLGAECRHMAREVVDLLQKCGFFEGWTNASERRLGCHLGDVVRTAGCGVQAALLLTGKGGLYVGGSRLDQMLRGKSSGTSCARLLRCLRNWDGLRSPISSNMSNWWMRCSLEGDSPCTSSFRSLVYGSSSGGEVMMSSTSAAYRWSSCEITWENFVVSLLTPGKKNCASALANHTAGRSVQNGGSPRPLSIPPLVVSCLQPSCFFGVTNIGCRYSLRQPRTISWQAGENCSEPGAPALYRALRSA
jgi:hypothetical protein